MSVPTANITPIYTAAPNIGRVTIDQASTNVNGNAPGTIGTNVFLLFSAGTDGSFLQRIRFSFSSTTRAINSVATLLNIYVSTVSSGAPTASEATLLRAIAAPAQTGQSVTSAPVIIDEPLNFAIPTGHHILVGQTVAQSADSNWNAILIGGDY
jgi:hypothetical protein